MAAVLDDAGAPALLHLVGHPLRWRLLAGLARSDRTVQELVALVAEPQNLVSYHLGKLRSARLVRSRRSAADGRDVYYAADVGRVGALLADVGGALHPGLRTTPAPPDLCALRAARARVLFLCTGNSARSQMAEALVVARSAGLVTARSAGSRPKPLHAEAVRVMADRYGIDIAGRRPTHVDDLAGEGFHRVITLCDKVREVCPSFPGTEAVHWSMADPSAASSESSSPSSSSAAGDDPFVATAVELDERIGFLLADLATSAPTPTPQEEP